MWKLANRTPFAAERTFLRDREGAEVLIVVVKATFAIGDDGAVRVAPEQAPIARTPQFHGDPARTSLVHDDDFALTKARTDVLLSGHARTIDDQPSIAVEVKLSVGAWSKRLVAIGERRWKESLSGWRLTDPEPFTQMPLVYERAFGGVDRSANPPVECDENPVGVGFLAPSTKPSDGDRAPNLESRDDPMRDPRSRPPPMCFAPIARQWSARRRLAGTYDDVWLRERRPLVPGDFDDAFWSSAPPDQRVALEGGERVELQGVSPRGTIRFELPRLAFSFRTRIAGATVEHSPGFHTLLFEPDVRRFVMVFQSALPCHHDIHSLERTVVEERSAA